MSNNTDQKMQTEFIAWLDQHPMKSAIAASLTFKPVLWEKPINPEKVKFQCAPELKPSLRDRIGRVHCRTLTPNEVAGAIRMYCRMLNYRAYGKRGTERLAIIPIREGGFGAYDKHMHYHMQIEVPRGWSAADWIAAAQQEWQKIRWASDTQNVFKEVTSDNWRSYIAKLRDKPSYADAIDWNNFWINRASE